MVVKQTEIFDWKVVILTLLELFCFTIFQ